MDYFDWYAAYLHRTSPVADAHFDLVTEVYRRRKAGETGILNQYYKQEFQRSGVNLIFASLFLGRDELGQCMENGSFLEGAVLKKSLEMLAAFYADMEETKGRVQLITDKASLLRITVKRGLSRQHKIGILLYLEGLDMLEGEPELLRCFYAMGVRGAALCWNHRKELPNDFAKGCGFDAEVAEIVENTENMEEVEKKENGIYQKGNGECCFAENKESWAITDKGVQALVLMEELGIFADSSHLSRQAAYLLPFFTKKPFAATHSNAAALLPHQRNLTDEEIKEIAERGGVIGVNAYQEFVTKQQEKEAAINALCDQIAYLLKSAGEKHVGFGLDLGEGTVIAGYRELPKITAQLLRKGHSAETVKKVLGENWIRFLLEVLRE